MSETKSNHDREFTAGGGVQYSLRSKLVRTEVAILAAVSVMILSAVAWLNVRTQKGHLDAIEQRIEASILSKGRVLVQNQSMALRGLVDDNAYGAVSDLVARTVREDPEVAVGLFLGDTGRPWAFFSPDKPPPPLDGQKPEERPGAVDGWKQLAIDQSQVPGDKVDAGKADWFRESVYTFSQTVVIDDEPMGTIHYGLSTAAMKKALAEAREEASAALMEDLLVLGGLAIAGMLVGFVLARRQAARITEPLQVLTGAAEKIASGERDVRADVHCGDEIELLAGAFNKMVGDLAASYEELESLNQGLEDKVEARTREVSRRNAEMRVVLDNVEQGLVTLDRDGVLSPSRSATFDDCFKVPSNDIAVWEALGAHDKNLGAWLEISWEQLNDGFLYWEVAIDQLPQNMKRDGRHYTLKFKPLLTEGSNPSSPEFRGALLITTDVTDQIAHEAAEAEQRESMSIFRQVMRDRAGFVEFFNEAEELVDSATSGVIDEPKLMMRAVHTAKGNCGIYGVESVAAVCHELESWVTENDAIPTPEQIEPLGAAWKSFADRVRELLGDDESEMLEITHQELQELIVAARHHQSHDDLAVSMERLRCEPLAKRFTRVAEQARSLANRLGKTGLQVVQEHNDLRLPAERWAPFWSSMIHVVRNALDHGIEDKEVRAEKGKPPEGQLTLRSRQSEGEFSIELIDDGAGIDWDRIRSKAKEAGLASETHENLVDALFADGLSSRDQATELSGRGVGMGAMRQACLEMGGRVEVASEPDKGTTFRFLIPADGNDMPAEFMGELAQTSLRPSMHRSG